MTTRLIEIGRVEIGNLKFDMRYAGRKYFYPVSPLKNGIFDQQPESRIQKGDLTDE